MRGEFFVLANGNEMQRSSATLNGVSGRQNEKRRKQMAQLNLEIVLVRVLMTSLDKKKPILPLNL